MGVSDSRNWHVLMWEPANYVYGIVTSTAASGGGKQGGSPGAAQSEQSPLDADGDLSHLKSTVWIIVRAPVRRRTSDTFPSKLMPHASPIAVL